MKRFILSFGVAVLMVAQAFAWGSSSYYASLTTKVAQSGAGMAYASTSGTESPDSYSATGNGPVTSDSTSKSGGDVTLHAWARPNQGWQFKGWATTDASTTYASTEAHWTASLKASTTKNGTQAYTYYAHFEKIPLPPFAVTFLPSVGGAYTVDGIDMSAGGASGTKSEVYEPKLVAKPAEGYAFDGWYQQDSADGEKVCISRELMIEKGAFPQDAWVSADFKELKFARTCDDLDEMLTGEYPTVVIENGATVTIPSGKSVVVPTGVTLDVQGVLEVNEGTLYVEGSLAKSGTITVTGNGKISKCTKLVVQQGQADGVPFNPYGDKKYWKTSIRTPTITVPSGVSVTSHAKVVNGLGETFRIALPDSARVLTVTRGASVAENHITGVSSVSTSADLKNTTSSAMFVLLTSDCVINKSTTAKTGFSGYVDCAGNNCSTVSSYEVSGNNGAAAFFNCPEFKVSRSVGTTHTFYNCQKVTVASLNAGNPCVNNFYDCGPTVSISYNKGPATGTYANFYSGTYDSIPTQTQVIYGGRYKTNPGKEGAYLASGRSLMVKQEGGYYVVYEHIAVNVAEIETGSGTEAFETLQAAFNKAGNGQTVRLIQNYEGNETATVAAGKNFSLELGGYSLLNTSGKIVNNGALWIKDSVTLDATKETSVLNWAIENNGVLETTYGAYKGNFTLNAGSRLTAHGGRFLNQLILGAGVTDPTAVADLRGGYFSMDLAAAGFLSQDYLQKSNWVGKFPYALVENATHSGCEKAWKVTALPPADLALYAKSQVVRPLPRAEYGSDADWNRRAELESMMKPYSGTIDCTLSFDRPTAEKSVKIYASAKITINEALDRTMTADEVYRVMITKILGANSTYSLFGYDRFLTGYDFTQTAIVGVADVNGANPGTVAKLELEVCHTTDRHADPQTPDLYAKDFAVATCRYMLGGGKAAIDRGTSRVTYDTLTAAVVDVQDGETILVGADTEEDVSFAKAGTFTIDPYGFAFTGSVTIDDGFFLREPATKSVSLAVAQGVSSAEATTYVVAQKVAQVGEMFYDNLNDAIAAAQTSGELILLLGAVPAPEGFMKVEVEGKTLLVSAAEVVVDVPETIAVTATDDAGQAIDAPTGADAVAAAVRDAVAAAQSVAVITGTGVLDPAMCSDEALVTALRGVDGLTEAEQEKITAESAILRYVSVRLTTAQVTATAAFAGLSFDVKPMVKTFVLEEDGAVKTVVAEIPSSALQRAITFRLPLTDAFTKVARVQHTGDSDRYPVVERVGEKRFVTVVATHFSPFKVSPADHVESAVGASNVLAIKRVPGVAGAAAGTEVVAAVPWRNVALTDDVTVDRLVATGVAEGDEIAAWMDGAKTYYTWRWNGTAWEPATDAKTGVKAPAASATTLLRGTAVWYKRANPSSAYSQVGGYDPATVTTAVTQGGATSANKPANTLLINPYGRAVDLTQILGASGDQIQTLADLKVYTYKDGRWGTMQLVEVTSPFGPVKKQKFVPATGAVVVPAGQGFWYISKGGKPEIDWKAIAPPAGE